MSYPKLIGYSYSIREEAERYLLMIVIEEEVNEEEIESSLFEGIFIRFADIQGGKEGAYALAVKIGEMWVREKEKDDPRFPTRGSEASVN
ncbi:hypothetical protein [Pseudomonas japonica]|uniref:Uncharacterized protein n=1 Tax=Pseudomonas japonica TaxID=256466 RepID=A0A239EVP6_9PSED|nr:hypothetical protein [Pseudomonas japonica]SNS48511.1 hypothetical protein SAMN05444352_108190 [Pseudomonas japonica]